MPSAWAPASAWSDGAIFELFVQGEERVLARLRAEAGGHRWQRIPPGEKRGRVHTSTVTVAVLDVAQPCDYRLSDADIEVFVTKDTGPGGQHRNKTESCIVMRHRPTGLEAKSAGRNQHQNRRQARAVLEARVAAFLADKAQAKRNADRRGQVGTGMRGDKIRTYRVRDDVVIDHRTGTKMRLSALLTGGLDVLVG